MFRFKCDKVQALTGRGRSYREARLIGEGLVIREGNDGIYDAAEYACEQVIAFDPHLNLDASRVAELIIEQSEFLEQNSLAA